MSRVVDTLLGGIFIAAAFLTERAEMVADWADRKLTEREFWLR